MLLVCLVSVTAIVGGTILVNRNSENESENLVELNDPDYQFAEDEEETTANSVSTAGNVVSEEETTQTDLGEVVDDVSGANSDPQAGEVSEITIPDAEEANVQASSLSFDDTSKLLWPIDGDVILDFSMDKTIYFPTLNVYKCNPAIIIQGDANIPVVSAAQGVVTAINTDEEIGTSIVISLGNNYEITYGQIKNPEVEVGDTVNEKDLLGYINEPTKYYCSEGYNLYLKLTKDGTPIDPLDYLDYTE